MSTKTSESRTSSGESSPDSSGNPFTTSETGMSTRQGYVLTSGEVTTSRAAAEADAANIAAGTATPTRRGFSSGGGGGTSTASGYVLSTGQTTTDRAAAETDAAKIAKAAESRTLKSVERQQYASLTGVGRVPTYVGTDQPKPTKASIKKQEDRIANVGRTYRAIAQNIGKGRLLYSVPVADEYKDTFLGDIGGFITKPAFIFGAPAVVAAPALGAAGAKAGVVGKGFLGAYAGSKAAFYGTRATETAIRYDKEEKKFLKTAEAKEKRAIGLRASDEAVGRIGQLDYEISEFNKQRGDLSNEDFTKAVREYYQDQGYSKTQVDQYTRAVVNQQQQGGMLTVPFLNKRINARAFANELTLFAGDKKAYERAIRDSYKDSGLSKSEIDSRVKTLLKERGTYGRGEIAAYVGVEIGGELTGQGLFTTSAKALQKAGTTVQGKRLGYELFKQGFTNIAPAGLVEGTTGVIVQQDIRKRQRDFKEIAFGGAAGALTAGIIGGATVSTSVTRPGTSKALQVAGYFVDPYEPLGDVGGDIIAKATRSPRPAITRISGQSDSVFKLGVITPGVTPITSIAPIPQISKAKATPTQTKKPSVQKPTTLEAIVGIPQPTKTPVNIPLPSRGRISSPVSIPSFTPSETPTVTPDPTPGVVPVFTPTDTPVTVPNITPTQTPTFTPVFTPVATPTPIFRIPPPILPGGGFGAKSKGGSSSKVRGKTYVNELVAGRAVLNSLLGTPPPVSRGKRKTKRGKTRSDNFLAMLFG